MEPQKIILFGGTFDPPHNGHIALLREAIAAVQPDQVLVMPSGIPPHKAAGSTPGTMRAAMCECFRPLFENLVIDTREIERGGKSYTIDTVRELGEEYPKAQLYFPMGSDMLLWFHNWVEYKELLRRLIIVAQVRRNEDAAAAHSAAQELRQQGGRVILTKAPVVAVSSTQVRAALQQGKPAQQLLPGSVAEYIERHGLYRKERERSTE